MAKTTREFFDAAEVSAYINANAPTLDQVLSRGARIVLVGDDLPAKAILPLPDIYPYANSESELEERLNDVLLNPPFVVLAFGAKYYVIEL